MNLFWSVLEAVFAFALLMSAVTGNTPLTIMNAAWLIVAVLKARAA